MSRIISGKIHLDVQRINLDKIIEAAIDTIQHAARAKGIELHVNLDPCIGQVSGDPSRLQQVFWNLLSNAVKFSGRGGNIRVSLHQNNSLVDVSVADDGEGIRPDFLPQVFDRFHQADSSTTRRHGGLGLGLSIVKQLVELHGGCVRAQSPGEGLGSTFTATLPLAPVESAAAPALKPRNTDPRIDHGSEASDEPQLTGLSVLMVDDDPDARLMIQRLLEDRGARVRIAGSVAEALDKMREEKPDLVVTDIGMPIEDGYVLIRKIRALQPSEGGAVPAIALTAYARVEDRMKTMLAGFQMHVAKPVEPAELTTIIASLAGRRQG